MPSVARSFRARAVLALLAAAAIIPIADAQGPGWTANATVSKLVVLNDGSINVRLSPDMTGCTPVGGYGPYFATIPVSHPGLKALKADLLYAYATGEAISLYLQNSTCQVGEMILGGW